MQIHVSDHERGVRLLRIERPPANAINTEFLQALHAAVGEAEADDRVRAVVVSGTGRFFSAGLDIKEMQAEANQAVHAPIDPGNAVFLKKLMSAFEKLAVGNKAG